MTATSNEPGEYLVTWAIEVSQDNPRLAAEQALLTLCGWDKEIAAKVREISDALTFTVLDHQGDGTDIDLSIKETDVLTYPYKEN